MSGDHLLLFSDGAVGVDNADGQMLGIDGLIAILKAQDYPNETAKFISAQIEKLGPFEVIYDGDMNSGIPALCWKMKDGESPGFSLYDLADRLRSRGWQVPAYSLPPHETI